LDHTVTNYLKKILLAFKVGLIYGFDELAQVPMRLLVLLCTIPLVPVFFLITLFDYSQQVWQANANKQAWLRIAYTLYLTFCATIINLGTLCLTGINQCLFILSDPFTGFSTGFKASWRDNINGQDKWRKRAFLGLKLDYYLPEGPVVLDFKNALRLFHKVMHTALINPWSIREKFLLIGLFSMFDREINEISHRLNMTLQSLNESLDQLNILQQRMTEIIPNYLLNDHIPITNDSFDQLKLSDDPLQTIRMQNQRLTADEITQITQSHQEDSLCLLKKYQEIIDIFATDTCPITLGRENLIVLIQQTYHNNQWILDVNTRPYLFNKESLQQWVKNGNNTHPMTREPLISHRNIENAKRFQYYDLNLENPTAISEHLNLIAAEIKTHLRAEPYSQKTKQTPTQFLFRFFNPCPCFKIPFFTNTQYNSDNPITPH